MTNHINSTLKDLQSQLLLTKQNSFIKESSGDILSITPQKDTKYDKTLRFLKTESFSFNEMTQILKKFGFKSLLNFQIIALNSLFLQKKSILITQPSNNGKSTIYQILSYLYEGLILVVSQKHAYLKKKLEKINNFISWGAINPKLGAEEQREIMDFAIKKRKLKILFITPEILLKNQWDFTVNLVVYEDPQNYETILNKDDFIGIPKLVLCPLLQMKKVKKLMNLLDIESYVPDNLYDLLSFESPYHENSLSNLNSSLNLISQNSINIINKTPNKSPISKAPSFLLKTPQKSIVTPKNKAFYLKNMKFIKEDEKIKFLTNFIKNQKKANFLIFCQNKKSVDLNISFLISQGIKPTLLNKNDKIDGIFTNSVIFSISGSVVDFSVKPLINYVIHLDFPLELEFYLDDISGFSENCGFLSILSNIEYFALRNVKVNEMIEKEKIEFLVKKYIFNNGNNENMRIFNENGKKTRIKQQENNENSSQMNEDLKNCDIFEKLQKIENLEKNRKNRKISEKTNDLSNHEFFDNYQKFSTKKQSKNPINFINFAQSSTKSFLLSLKFKEISKELCIKPEILSKILQYFENKGFLKFLSERKTKGAINFKNSMKMEKILENSNFLKTIYYYSLNKNGKFTFYFTEIERETRCSNEEIIEELKK